MNPKPSSPSFNAGYGAVFTHEGTHELDAAIMDGATLRAGAVACVSRVRRPLRAALVFRASNTLAAPLLESSKLGTVGAVALNSHGNLAAATSTGGMTNKRCGRVGDSPLIGAGTYADNRTAAISCTGTGEVFIRGVVAYDICARMAYGGQTLDIAAHEVVMKTLAALGGRGGLIAVDAQGHLSFPFNTEGMYRGHARLGEAPQTAIFVEGHARIK